MGNELNNFMVGNGYSLLTFAEIDSTNLEARRQILKGATIPMWIVASLQLKGRGRRGNQWVSPPGNLYCSLALPMEKDLSQSAELSFVAANALHKTFVSLGLGLDRVKTKWPNDVWVDGKKISGILLEVCENKAQQKHIIIGMGVNIAHSPESADYQTTNLKKCLGENINISNFFNKLSEILNLDYQEWLMTGFGFARGYWLKNSMGLGKEITVCLPNEELQGIFSGLSEDGALLLENIDGQLTPVYAGDVFFT
jgi:BirA family biotin operon repressor/biotin-[acetyl-CoA-carboxylase] ligase